MAKTTGNTQFHSRSNKIGSSKWQFTKPPVVPRGYVLDLLTSMPYLPNRFYAIALVHQANKYSFRVYGYGSGAEASLEDADLQAILAAGPVINVELNTTDEAVALERFERVVSNVMHKLLEPTAAVASLWLKFATTDGQNMYR